MFIFYQQHVFIVDDFLTLKPPAKQDGTLSSFNLAKKILGQIFRNTKHFRYQRIYYNFFSTVCLKWIFHYGFAERRRYLSMYLIKL